MLKFPVEVPNCSIGSSDVCIVNSTIDGDEPQGYPKGTQIYAYVNSRAIIAIVPRERANGTPQIGCYLKLVDGHTVYTTLSADEAAELCSASPAKT